MKPGDGPEAPPRRQPRGVRVTLAGAWAGAGLPPMVVQQAGSPLVDGESVPAVLRRVDGEHALLERDGGPVADEDRRGAEAEAGPDRVLLLPPTRGSADGVHRREVVVSGWRIEVEIEAAARAALRERATRGREQA